jgi:hypothetical protein
MEQICAMGQPDLITGVSNSFGHIMHAKFLFSFQISFIWYTTLMHALHMWFSRVMRNKYYYDEWFITRDVANKERCVCLQEKVQTHVGM